MQHARCEAKVRDHGMKKEINGQDYPKLVEWSEEDGCFVGSAPPLIGPSCHGADEAEVHRALHEIVEQWITIHKDDGRKLPEPNGGRGYGGRVRVGEEMHPFLATLALHERAL